MLSSGRPPSAGSTPGLVSSSAALRNTNRQTRLAELNKENPPAGIGFPLIEQCLDEDGKKQKNVSRNGRTSALKNVDEKLKNDNTATAVATDFGNNFMLNFALFFRLRCWFFQSFCAADDMSHLGYLRCKKCVALPSLESFSPVIVLLE